MNAQQRFDELLARYRSIRAELETEIDNMLDKKREQFNYTLHRSKAIFDRESKRLQRRDRIGSLRYVVTAPISHWLSSPVIYGMIFPLLILDITITIYQHICFRVYGIPTVKRSTYFVLDRHRLPYLNTVQKLNCVYCGYANGLIAYAREILARTEQYWCPIKHALRQKGLHERESKFFHYGDAEAWRDQLEAIRCDWEESAEKK